MTSDKNNKRPDAAYQSDSQIIAEQEARIKKLERSLSQRNALITETFGRQFSDEFFEELLDAPDNLTPGGSRRCITILMSDLRGFTTISESMPPDDLLTMLNHYLAEMTDIIHARNGTIIEFIGDGITAIFGAPKRLEMHSEAALAAAIEMQQKMNTINEWNVENGWPQLEMGIGIHTGDVILGNIGSVHRMKYGVAGQTVNLCGRIEGYTLGGQVLLSGAVLERLKARPDIAEARQVLPKGSSSHLMIYEVDGLGAPYNISCRKRVPEPEPLEVPAQARIFHLNGKEVDPEAIPCLITAAGISGLQVQAKGFVRDDNVLVPLCDREFYAKVQEADGDRLKLRFTSLPLYAERMLNRLHENTAEDPTRSSGIGRLFIFGCRGAAPLIRESFFSYGVNTSCFLLERGNDAPMIFLDAGTGLTTAGKPIAHGFHEVHILISHVHMDHIQGLYGFAPFFNPNCTIHIYGEIRDGKGIHEQLEHLLAPPYWPVGINDFTAKVFFHDFRAGDVFHIGNTTVQTCRSFHPDSCTLYRLDGPALSLGYGLDCELSKDTGSTIAEFFRNCGTVIADACYLPGQVVQGFGHSTDEEWLDLQKKAGISRILAAHYSADYTDTQIAAEELRLKDSSILFAREGMALQLSQ